MAENDFFNVLWADAIAEYEKQTKRKIGNSRGFNNFQRLEDLDKAIEKGESSFTAFRGEHREFYRKLQKCMKPLQPVLRIIQEGVGNTPYAPACIILGAGSYLLDACESVSKDYDGIETLFEEIARVTTRLQEYLVCEMSASLRKIMTQILTHILHILGTAERCIRGGRRKLFAKVTIQGNDEVIAAISRLHSYVEAEIRLIVASTFKSVKQIEASTAEMVSNQRNDRQKAFSESEKSKVAEHLKSKAWEEIHRQHAENKKLLVKDTGDWLLADPKFRDWENGLSPILWIFGKPGFGKTMMATRAIEALRKKHPQHRDIPSLTSVSFLYCKDDSPSLQDCAQMLKVAALQISKANPKYSKHVAATIASKGDALFSADQIWKRLFLDYFLSSADCTTTSSSSVAYLIVDGLDEAPKDERAKFLTCFTDCLKQTAHNLSHNIRIVVFSRSDIRDNHIAGAQLYENMIELTLGTNKKDLDLYIKQRLRDLRVLETLKGLRNQTEYRNLAKDIYEEISQRSQGMFLWGRLAFDQIRAESSPEFIRRLLKDCPTGLESIIHRVFQRLDLEESNKSYLREIISWVHCTFRPMDIRELFTLLTITAKQHCYGIKDDLKGRYSSIFDVTLIDSNSTTDGTEDLHLMDRSTLDEEDFAFLDEPSSLGSEGSQSEEDSKLIDGSVDLDAAHAGYSEDWNMQQEHNADLPLSWSNMEISFSHALIGNLLEREGRPSERQWHDCPIVPNDLNHTQLQITLACIGIIKDLDGCAVQSLKVYAKLYWMEHLEKINIQELDSQDARLLARSVSDIFASGSQLLETAFPKHISFAEDWFTQTKFSGPVRHLIAAYIDDIDPAEQDWARLAVHSARSLFLPFVSACASKWLCRSGWDDTAYIKGSNAHVWLIDAFDTLVSILLPIAGCRSLIQTIDGLNERAWEDIKARESDPNYSKQALELLARLVPKEEDEHWLICLASVLFSSTTDDDEGKLASAIHLFNQAILLAPNAWPAFENLAYISAIRLDYTEAIRCIETAIEHIPDTGVFKATHLIFDCKTARWMLSLGEKRGALIRARQANLESQKW